MNIYLVVREKLKERRGDDENMKNISKFNNGVCKLLKVLKLINHGQMNKKRIDNTE